LFGIPDPSFLRMFATAETRGWRVIAARRSRCFHGRGNVAQSNGSVAKDGGANPVSGYSLIEAKDYEDAVAKAKGCPLLAAGGSVEVAEAMDM
jgi:hypothetical protein